MPPTPQVSALVTMYSHEEDIDGAIDVFKQAIAHYQSEQVCFHIQQILHVQNDIEVILE